MWTYILVIVLNIQIYSCKPSYRDYIPNGYIVPNPCFSPGVWDAVGHYNPVHHTLIKNQFGVDYGSETRWSHRLCHMDSDRDNKTNGAELGDPNCDWFTGELLTVTPIGHPEIGNKGWKGTDLFDKRDDCSFQIINFQYCICEPVGSPWCIREQGFTCNDLENSANLKP